MRAVELRALPLAHETWFERDRSPTDCGFAGAIDVLFGLLLVWGSDPRLRPLVSGWGRVQR